MDIRAAEFEEFGVTQHKTLSDGGVRLPRSAFDGERDEEGGPVTLPHSLSDGNWKLIASVITTKKAAERGAVSAGAVA